MAQVGVIRRLSLGEDGTLVQADEGGGWQIDLTRFRHKTSKFYVSCSHTTIDSSFPVHQGPSITTLCSPVASMLVEYLEMEGRMPGVCSFEFTERDQAVNRADIEYLSVLRPLRPMRF